MTPVSFDGCFGWLHAGWSDRGVVLCGPLGHEAVATHQGWRQLADTLCGQGLHVVRFDYRGTGDSVGDDADAARLQNWQQNVENAAVLLRHRCQVTSITLVGLRFGAALAMMAAPRIDAVNAIALLAPAISGKTHLRELRLLARVWHEQAFGKGPPQDPEGGLEVTGTRHSAETIRAIGAVDLRKTTAFIPRVLLMDSGDRAETAQLADRLGSQGCVVTRLPFAGEAAFLTEPVTSRVPHDAFDQLAAWIGEGPSYRLHPPLVTVPDAVIELPGAVEMPLRFGSGAMLFGILCRPAHLLPEAPIVIMVNTGRTPHTGDGRFYVTLARALAGRGVASLRMDVAGMGDSDADPRFGRTALHDVSSCADVSAAIDRVASLGWAKVTLIGVCSGAFLAFQTALRDERVSCVDLINQQRFLAAPDRLASARAAPLRRPASFYLRSLLRGVAWRAVLSGRVNPAQVALGVIRPVVERQVRLVGRLHEVVTGQPNRGGVVHRSFRELAKRELEVRMWYGDTDPGWSELESWFGRGGNGLRRFRNVRLETLIGADHALHRAASRARLITLICDCFTSNQSVSDQGTCADRTGSDGGARTLAHSLV